MTCYKHITDMLQQLLNASQSPAPPTHSPIKPGPPSQNSANQNQQQPNPKQQVNLLLHKVTIYGCANIQKILSYEFILLWPMCFDMYILKLFRRSYFESTVYLSTTCSGLTIFLQIYPLLHFVFLFQALWFLISHHCWLVIRGIKEIIT